MQNTLIPLVLSLVSAFAGASSQGAGEPRPWDFEQADLPVHAGIRFGHLDNGLRYAWLANAEPPDRIQLVLHVAVGSLAEREGEQGMANLLRELAFLGTERTSAEELQAWMESSGTMRQDDIARSGYRDTVYAFELGAGNEEAVARGLDVLRGIADGLRFTDETLAGARERIAAVEALEQASPFSRALRRSYELLLAGTAVPARPPLGTEASRQGFDGDGLRAFYASWYRPENMTVILVGDLGERDPSAAIEAALGDLPVPSLPPRSVPAAGYPSELPPAYIIHDEEFDRVVLSIENLRPAVPETPSREALTREMPAEMARRMLNMRFARLSQQPDAPFQVAGCDTASRRLGVFRGEALSITCTKERWREALAFCDLELRSALTFGFRPAELKRLRDADLTLLDRAGAQAASQRSNQLAAEILQASEGGLAPLGIAGRRDLFRPALEALDVETCRRAFASSWEDGQRVIGSVGQLDLGRKGDLLLSAAFSKVRRMDPKRPERLDSEGFAYTSSAELAGEIVELEHVEDLDFERVVFANGVRVLLKQMPLDDQMLVSARFGAGAMTAAPEDAARSWVASRVFFGSGLAEHSVTQLARLLAGRAVGADFSVNEDFFELTGGTRPEDLLLQCELLCAYFNDPGWRPEGLRLLRSQVLPQTYAGLEQSLGGPLASSFTSALYGGDPRFGLPPREAVEAVDMADLREWLAPQLASAALQITIVGDFELEEAVAAAARTFGVMPPRGGSTVLDAALRPVRLVTGLRTEVEVPIDRPRALVTIFFPTTDGRNASTRHDLSFLGRLLAVRLQTEVPARLDAEVSVSADSFSSTAREGSGFIQIRGSVEPQRAAEFVEACLEAAQVVAESGITEAEVARQREPILAQLELFQTDSRYWVGVLAETHNRPEALDEARAAPAHYSQVSKADLDALAARYLLRERASVLIVRPRQAGQ